jgi:hypothetical protein
MTTANRLLRVSRRGILVAASGLLAAPAVVRAQGANGVALVIGNSKYKWETSLPNVKRDAADIAKRFQVMGLRTEVVNDANRQSMQQAIDKFKAAARGANFASFYFAGHGTAWGKDTYLVPEDADLGNPNDVQKTLIPVSAVRAAMDEARHRLLVFDSCRNNPSDGWRQLQVERTAAMEERQRELDRPSPDTLILYSTAAGRIAMDGPAGENSPFAATLLRQLAAPSIDLQALETKLRRDLLVATEGRQILWSQNSYAQPFTIAGGKGAAPAATGWGNPARIIELPNAYAFAQQNNLPLPPGLVSHRPGKNSPHFQKAGSFKWDDRKRIGVNPSLIIALSIEDNGQAEILLSTRNDRGPFWRCTTATVSGAQLQFEPDYKRPLYILNWSDANSGSATQRLPDRRAGNAFIDAKFTRLDG